MQKHSSQRQPLNVSSTSNHPKKSWYIQFMDKINKNWMMISFVFLVIVLFISALVVGLKVRSNNKKKIDSNPVIIQSKEPVCYYTVGPSDTLASIASQLGIQESILQSNNPSIDFTNLQTGSKLVIPGAVCYTTVSGDTCDSIANKYYTTVSMLQSMNPSLSCDTIIAGQTLLVLIPGMYPAASISTLPLKN